MKRSTFFNRCGTNRPSASARSTNSCTPMASSMANGPISQLNPHFMALSTASIESAISGIRETV